MKYVYIASPYTKGDVAVNVRRNIMAADQLAEHGYYPFSPLLTHFWHLIIPHPIDFWYRLDLKWIDRCDVLIRLPGESSGADQEVSYARVRKMPVFFSVEEFLING